MDKELRLAIKEANNNVAEQAAIYGTKWHFIPPASAHFGGLWEAGVKSTKHHLKKAIGESLLTYEELSTVLIQIEACLNSRPIFPMSNDPDDYEALTPGHFLIGRPLISPPEANKSNVSASLRWAILSKMVKGFWKIWSMEYLMRLQQRPKWKRQGMNYEIGQLVLIKDENLPPTKWTLGRITNVHPGPDNLIRVVSLRGPKNVEFKRPITKISALPIEDNQGPITESSKDISTANEEKGNRCRRNKVYYQNTIFAKSIYAPLFLLAIIINICISSAPPFNITKFDSEPGIYFEYIGDLKFTNNNWNIVVYYNLTTYYAELEGYRRCINRLNNFCLPQYDNFTNSSITSKYKRDICALIEPPFQHSLLEMEHKDELLHHKKVNFGRSKRGAFNLVGNVASSLFGVLDDRDAAHYEEEIEKLRQNNNHLLMLMKNQTSIIDATVNVFKKRQEDIDQHWQVFKRQMAEALEGKDETNNLLALSIHTLLLTISFKETQDTLIDAVLDTHNRVTTTRLLTTQQLKSEVDFMARNLPSEIMLPNIEDTDDILTLYQIITTKTRLRGNYLIFELKIPLVYKDVYQTYKPIPLPTTNKPSTYIRPQVELLATDLHRHSYTSMSQSEWQSCISTKDFRICKLSQPVYQNQENNSICELQLLRQETVNNKCEIVERNANHLSDTWIQLQDHRWIFSIQQERTISIVCQQQPFSTKLSNSGIISLSSGCTLKGTNVNILARQKYNHEIHLSLLPTFNLSNQIARPQDASRSYHFQDLPKIQGIDQLQKQIKEEMINERNTLSHHHVHHYALAYVLTTILLAILLYIVIRRMKQFLAARNKPPTVAPLEDIAFQTSTGQGRGGC